MLGGFDKVSRFSYVFNPFCRIVFGTKGDSAKQYTPHISITKALWFVKKKNRPDTLHAVSDRFCYAITVRLCQTHSAEVVSSSAGATVVTAAVVFAASSFAAS